MSEYSECVCVWEGGGRAGVNIQKVRMHKGPRQMRTVAYKGGEGPNFGDFCAQVLCG